MIVKLPIIHNEELLYSFLARIHQISGKSSLKDTMKEFYNSNCLNSSILLTSNISVLIYNMPDNVFGADELIHNHTLFNYFTAFFNDKKTKEIKEKMLSSNGKVVYRLARIQAYETQLKYCEDCNAEMISEGTLYWKRLFQIPEVKVCPVHSKRLKYSTALKGTHNKYEYVATSERYFAHNRVIHFKDKYKDHLIRISEDVNWILTHYFQRKNLEWIKNRYMNILVNKKFANVNRRIRVKVLLKEFINFYGHDFLELMQVDIDEEASSNWLTDLVRINQRSASPLKHLLLIRFLGLTFSQFMNENLLYKPFGSGPWKCTNLICAYYDKKVIMNHKLEYSINTKNTRGLFRCEFCGYENYRYEESNNIRVINYGPVWERKLKELIKARMSLRSVARQLGVDPKVVIKKVIELDLNHNCR